MGVLSTPQSMFIILSDRESVKNCGEGIQLYLDSLNYPNSADLAKDWVRATLRLQRAYCGLSTQGSRREWIDAFKRHRNKVSEICSELISESVINKVSNPVAAVTRSKITVSSGLELEEVKIQPRAFWCIYRLFGYVQTCKNSNELIAVCQVITTLASQCKDFRLIGAEQDENVLEQIREIEAPNEFDPSTATYDWDKELHQTFKDISDTLSGQRSNDLRYCLAFSASVQKTVKGWLRPTMSPDKLKLSSSSSGMFYYKHSGEHVTLPSYIASMFEWDLDTSYDYSKYDDIIGYQCGFADKNEIRNKHINAVRNKAVAIEQKKPDMRIINLLCCSLQDRLQFVEEHTKLLLRNLAADCKYNQLKGPMNIYRWMSMSNVRVVNSLDLHAATNRMSIEWQSECLRQLLSWFGYSADETETIISTWLHIMRLPIRIQLPHSKKGKQFRFASGQPMGFNSSFDSFSILHHIAVLTLNRLCARKGIKVIGYNILGDDFVNAIERDSKQEFCALYRELMAFLGVECNLAKGYIYNADVAGKELKIAEFAKFLVCQGQDVSPIPLVALSKSNNFGTRITLLSWLSQHNQALRYALSPKLVQEFCGADSSELAAITLLADIPMKNIFNSRHSSLSINQLYADDDKPIVLCASLAWLKQSVILESLAELKRNPDYIPKISDELSFPRSVRKLIMSRLNAEEGYILNNKFYQYYHNLRIIAETQSLALESCLKGIFPDSDIIDVIPSLMKWSEQDFQSLVYVSQVWEDLHTSGESDGQDTTPFTEEQISTLLMTLESIDKYDFDSTNHRFMQDSKDKAIAGLDIHQFYTDLIANMKKLNINNEQLDLYLERASRRYNFEAPIPARWDASPVEFSDDEFDDDIDDTFVDDVWAQILA